MPAPRLSVIIPVLNEAACITGTLQQLVQSGHDDYEIIVVDGGSSDGTVDLASGLARVISAPRGRARQMNAGAAVARGEVLLFLHADTLLPAGAGEMVCKLVREGGLWGRFDVSLSGGQPLLRLVERMMNLRSCLTSVATGDQAIFVRTDLFERVGGYDDIMLMEDIALSKKLRRHARVVCVNSRVVTSSRRWEQQGIVRTILLMWWLRLLYASGVAPDRLAALYSQ